MASWKRKQQRREKRDRVEEHVERYNGKNWERVSNEPASLTQMAEVIDRVLAHDIPKSYSAPTRVFLEPRAQSVIAPEPEVVKPVKIYAGIGSRETPPEVMEWMERIGEQLARAGWILRSGFADGADNAFARGADAGNGAMELFVPWPGFNNAPTDHPAIINVQDLPLAIQYHMADIAEAFHPNWKACTPAAKKLHTRNVPQICGADLNSQVACVICWTPGGKSGGGTGQAIRIARDLKIPIFDLFNETDRQAMTDFVNSI